MITTSLIYMGNILMFEWLKSHIVTILIALSTVGGSYVVAERGDASWKTEVDMKLQQVVEHEQRLNAHERRIQGSENEVAHLKEDFSELKPLITELSTAINGLNVVLGQSNVKTETVEKTLVELKDTQEAMKDDIQDIKVKMGVR